MLNKRKTSSAFYGWPRRVFEVGGELFALLYLSLVAQSFSQFVVIAAGRETTSGAREWSPV